ncbi:hypothetical protein ILUMI_19453 [Ignelater luminosus]|uniref:Uncharacterized protein n=1 Tax=Ignelater luminosus TaxID=2038154 RepID=A0A8K0CN17_IGNLU|nr:hypothetical protein ILUMI_19453 [Ignelater luminosus]
MTRTSQEKSKWSGLNGGCRRADLCNLKVDEIQDNGLILIVTLNDTKTKKKRIFKMSSDCNGYELCKKCARLTSCILKITNVRCKQLESEVLQNTPQRDCRVSASFKCYLLYNTLSRSSAAFLADSGGDVQMLKRHGGWRSGSVAEG